MGCNASRSAVEPRAPVHDASLSSLIGKYGKPVDSAKDTPASKDRGMGLHKSLDEDIVHTSLAPTLVQQNDISSSLQQTKEVAPSPSSEAFDYFFETMQAQLQITEDLDRTSPDNEILPSEVSGHWRTVVAAISQRRKEAQESPATNTFWENMQPHENPNVTFPSTEVKTSEAKLDLHQAETSKRDLSHQPTDGTLNLAIENPSMTIQPKEDLSSGGAFSQRVDVGMRDLSNQTEDIAPLRPHEDPIVEKSEVQHGENSKLDLSDHPTDVSPKSGHLDERPIGDISFASKELDTESTADGLADIETITVTSKSTYASLDVAVPGSTDTQTQLMMDGVMDTIYTGVGDFSMGYIHACFGTRTKLAIQDAEAPNAIDNCAPIP